MQIVHLNASGQMGGAETSLLQLLSSVRAARPDWKLCVIAGSDGPFISKLTTLGVDVEVLPFPSGMAKLGDSSSPWKLPGAAWQIRSYASQLSRLLRAKKPDVIHAAGLKMQVLACWARPAGVPLLWHIHDFVGRRRIMSRLIRLHSRRCSLAIANSHSVAADLQRICPSLPMQVIYNAVDPQRFHPEGPTVDLDKLSHLPAAPDGTLRVGLLATFARWKGHTVFLDALKELGGSLPVRGYIVGGPIYQTDGSQYTMNQLRQEVGRRGLSGSVGLTGFIDDAPAALRSLDVAVHASTDPEPFGMVIIEAMACGKPVIASLAGGSAELVCEGETGLGHPPGDSSALAAQLRRVLENRALRATLSVNGRRFAEQHFCPQRLTEALIPLYERLRASRADSAKAA